ncbi:hypothetical protein QE152_g129 [Popillia japonica]|uniref:Uncharacterized protein n=1 Tax=Popillia japonica TaxID=7064 RepID=A0AAW1NH74_POPJA
MLLRVASAFRTVSASAVQVVTAMIPIEPMVEERIRLHQRNERSQKRRTRDHVQLWQRKWRNTQEVAQWTKSLIQRIERWTNRLPSMTSINGTRLLCRRQLHLLWQKRHRGTHSTGLRTMVSGEVAIELAGWQGNARWDKHDKVNSGTQWNLGGSTQKKDNQYSDDMRVTVPEYGQEEVGWFLAGSNPALLVVDTEGSGPSAPGFPPSLIDEKCHAFPLDDELFKKWCSVMKREDLLHVSGKKRDTITGNLKKTAVPSLFLPDSLEVEPGCSKRSASPLCSEEPKIVKGDTLQSEEETDETCLTAIIQPGGDMPIQDSVPCGSRCKTPVDKLKSRRRIVAKTPRKHRISLLRTRAPISRAPSAAAVDLKTL